MDALARAKAKRAGHRGIVTKAINDVNQHIGNPADLQDIAAVTEQLRALDLCKARLLGEQQKLPALDDRVQVALTNAGELEADIVRSSEIDGNIHIHLLKLDDFVSTLQAGPPPQAHHPGPGTPTQSAPVQQPDQDNVPAPALDDAHGLQQSSRSPSILQFAPADQDATTHLPDVHVRLPKLSHPAGVPSYSADPPSPQSPQRPPPALWTEQPGSTSTPAISQATCALSQPACLAAGEQVILQPATTTISADHGPPTRARLLLDSGSQRTYMSERLASKLRLQPVLEEPLSVSTFGDTRPFTVNTSLVHFQLGLKDGSRMALTANVIPNITGAIHRGTTPATDEAFLRALPPDMPADNIPSANDNASKVDLLFGSDFFWTIMESDRLTLPSGLLLISSKLRYILTGKCTSHQPTKEVGTLFVHTQVMQSLTTSAEPTFSSPADSCLAPTPNLADFWSSATIGIT